MNIEKWIEDNSFLQNTSGNPLEAIDYEVVDVSDLRELLKTHAIVPREPSFTMIAEGRCRAIKPITYDELENIYKAMIKAAKEE